MSRSTRIVWPLLEVAGIFALFALYAGSPPPDVNETCYLCKAKHFWNPDWCPGDIFLDSADAHLVFYWTCGWLTRIVSLPTAAWIGRVVFWGGLAVAWRSLSISLVAQRGAALLTASLWLLGLHYCHMMGEWVVGTIEGKSIAYVFVLFGLAALVRQQWNRTWMWFGAAAMFHVLVGGWCVVAAGIAWLLPSEQRPRFSVMIPGLLVGFVLSLPGLVPALWLSAGVSEATVEQAEMIYVFTRLAHHLVIHTRPIHFVARFLALAACWVILVAVTRRQPSAQRLHAFVAGAIMISIVGALIEFATLAQPAMAAHWLRYYWFRLADATVPAGVALGLAVWLDGKSAGKLAWRAVGLAVSLASLGLIASWPSLWTTQLPRASLHQWGIDGRNTVTAIEAQRDWVQMCSWVQDNTPEDAHFLTPYNQQTFKWYAGRAEAATWKDIPQDAKSTVEWWSRISHIYADGEHTPLAEPSSDTEISSIRLRSLADMDSRHLIAMARKYHCQYIILDCGQRTLDLIPGQCVYPTSSGMKPRFRVYAVPDKPVRIQNDVEP